MEDVGRLLHIDWYPTAFGFTTRLHNILSEMSCSLVVKRAIACAGSFYSVFFFDEKKAEIMHCSFAVLPGSANSFALLNGGPLRT